MVGRCAGPAGAGPGLCTARWCGSGVRRRSRSRLPAGSAPLREDPRWDELDQYAQFATIDTMPDESDAAAFQRWYESAMGRWSAGEHDDDYTETYAAFHDRAAAALADVAEVGTVVVASSGGPISALVTRLLEGSPQLGEYARLLPTTVNPASPGSCPAAAA